MCLSLTTGCPGDGGDGTASTGPAGDPTGASTTDGPATDPTASTGPSSTPTSTPTGDPTSEATGDPTGDPTSGPTTDTAPDPTTGETGDTDAPPACADPPLWDDGLAPTASLHVAVDGADGPDCGAEASPCATIEGALALAGPGTAVVVHAGEYAPDIYLEGVGGAEGAPIWIGGAPGEARPAIVGGGEGLHLTRPRHLILHDLEVRGASGNGVNIDDGGDYDDPTAAAYVGLRGLWIHDIGGGGNEDCLKLSGLNDFFVVDGEFSACGGGGAGSGVDHVGCHRGVLAGNDFHDISGNAVQCKGGSQALEIRQNRMFEAGERAVNLGGSTGFEFFRPPLVTGEPNAEAREIRVVANLIVGSNAPLAFVGCVACEAVNNTIVRPHNWIVRILQETVSQDPYEFLPASAGVVRNNLIVFERADLSTYVNIGGNTDPGSFSFSHNLWYALDDPAQSDPAGDLPVAEDGGIVGMDPQLVDLDADPTPAAGSPAIQAGVAPAGAALDRAGRCYADPPSIGAYEPAP